MISLCLRCVYELRVGCIYWHVRRLEYVSRILSKYLKVADILCLSINRFYPNKTTCITKILTRRGLSAVIGGWCSDATGIRCSWGVYGISQHGGRISQMILPAAN